MKGSAPLAFGVVLDERTDSPVLDYAAARLVAQIQRLAEQKPPRIWVLERPATGLSPLARGWNAFDARRAGIKIAAPADGLPRISSIGALGRDLASAERPDLIFVCGAHPGLLQECAQLAEHGAFELRQEGVPLGALSDLAWTHVLERRPVLAVELCFLARGESDAMSFGPWEFRTHRASPAGTAKELIDGCSLFLELALDALSRREARERLPRVPARGGDANGADDRRALALVREFGLRKAAGRLKHLKVRDTQWGIGLIPRASDPLGLAEPPEDTRWLESGSDVFWADPFLVDEAGRAFLLFEELPFAEPRGYLCAAELPSQDPSRPGPRRKILEKDFHLSFPFCFRHEGKTYLLPEQASSGRVQSYRARRFPDEWEDGPVLLSGFAGIDSVLVEHGKRWWLFSTSARDGNHDNHLMLFHSDSPFGPFVPHPLNPVKMGLAGARMGGAIFSSSGKLLRPGQDCTRGYGSSLIFFEIEKLTETEYRERPVHELRPAVRSLFPGALHSWSSSSQLAAIDGQRELQRWPGGRRSS